MADRTFEKLINISQDLICIAGMDGYFKFVNPAWTAVLGYSEEELSGKPFLSFIYEGDHDKTRAELKKLAMGELTTDFINRYIHRDGCLRTISWRATPVPDEGVIYCIGRDITKHLADEEKPEVYRAQLEKVVSERTLQLEDVLRRTEKVEKDLRESEQKFKRMFEQAPLSYQSLDEGGNFTEVNNTWLETMGYRREEVVGRNFSEFLVPEWQDHFKTNFPRFKAVGEVLGVEFEMVKKNGSVILVSFHGKIGRDKNGNFQRTHCVFHDISKQRSAEKTIEKDFELNKSIAKISTEFLSESYDIQKVADVTLDAAKRITDSAHGYVSSIDRKTHANIGHTLTEMFGSECQAQDDAIIFPIGADGRYGGLWGHALNTKEPFYTNTPEAHVSAAGLPDGHIPLSSFMAVPVLIGEKLIGLIALANSEKGYSEDDIGFVQRIAEIYALALHRNEYEAERKQMEKNMRQLQKREAIGSLAGGVAHDFNNILSPIIGFAELLQEDIPEESFLQESVYEILTAAKRARELVRQILSFSRETEQEIRPVKPHLVIKEIIRLIYSTIPRRITIKENIDVASRMIMADPTQLHQVAMNLITNAMQAMQDTEGVLEISLKNTHLDYNRELPQLLAGPYVMLTVSDTGTGITPETIEKIFDPYFSTKPKDKGTGLGLSVAQGIVRNYGGRIEVESMPGEGTIFNVLIPSIADENDTVSPPAAEKENEDRDGTILFVDDEASIVRYQKKMLERHGYCVDISESGEDALKKIVDSDNTYDLVITDMNMPRMAGDILIRKMREAGKDVPVIICTGFSEYMTVEKAEKIGAAALLMKPIVKSELLNLISTVLTKNTYE